MVIWHFEKLCFWINSKEMLYRLNFASWVKLRKSCEKSREVQGFLFWLRSIGEGVKVSIKDSSRVKYRCGLVVDYKLTNSRGKLLCYLSSYTIFLILPFDPPTLRAPETVIILYFHLRALGPGWFQKRGRVVIALILALIFNLAIDLPNRTSMVGLVTKVNDFTLSVLLSIKLAVNICRTI